MFLSCGGLLLHYIPRLAMFLTCGGLLLHFMPRLAMFPSCGGLLLHSRVTKQPILLFFLVHGSFFGAKIKFVGLGW
jgi:hypothetical protein